MLKLQGTLNKVNQVPCNTFYTDLFWINGCVKIRESTVPIIAYPKQWLDSSILGGKDRNTGISNSDGQIISILHLFPS